MSSNDFDDFDFTDFTPMPRAMTERPYTVAHCDVGPTSRRVFYDRQMFRSGMRATFTTITTVLPDGSHRLCYLVQFDDGAKDLWPMHDKAAEYEFDRF